MDSRVRSAGSYYYNKIICCSDSFRQLANDPTIKGIISKRQSIEKKISRQQIEKSYRVVESDDTFIILLKPQ